MQSTSLFRTTVTFLHAVVAASLLVAFSGAEAWPTERPGVGDLQAIKQLKVVYVDDGDTIVGLNASNQQIKVRLASIDAPESSHTNKERGRVGQPFSENAKRHLEALVKGRTIDVSCVDADRYGRIVCDLFVQGKSVNAELVRAGWAWANTASNGRYLRDRSFLQLQADAQKARAGLWAGADPVAPWDWRKQCWERGACPN